MSCGCVTPVLPLTLPSHGCPRHLPKVHMIDPKITKKKKKLDFIQPPFPRSKVTMMMDNPNTHSQHFQHPELLLDQGFSLHQKHIATCQCQGDLVQPGWGWTCLGLQVPPLLQGVDDPFDPCHIDLVTMAS